MTYKRLTYLQNVSTNDIIGILLTYIIQIKIEETKYTRK